MKYLMFLNLLLLFLSPLSPAWAQAPAGGDCQVVLKQFCDFQRESWKASQATAKGQDDEALVGAWMKSLTIDGTWPDLNYADADKGYWRVMNHLLRLNKMALVYTTPDGKLYKDPTLALAIHGALGNWLTKDYQNPSWWHNLIGVPTAMSTILALLNDDLTPQEREGGIKILSRAVLDPDKSPEGRRNGGQNRINIAESVLVRALLSNDPKLAQDAIDEILGEVVVNAQPGGMEPKVTFPGGIRVFITTQDGIQADNSYHMHGPMLQFGGYGLLFGASTTRWMTILHGTQFALPEDKVTIIRNFLINGEGNVVWKGSMDINSVGRQVLPNAQELKGAEVVRVLKAGEAADAVHAADYQKALDQILLGETSGAINPKNTWFWRSDYMVQRRPTYLASTRMNSVRVYATETANGDNLLGTYLGDGATYLYQTGHEYEAIFPVWDWSRIPGVTCPAITDLKALKHSAWKSTNPVQFVGGVSDGLHGACVLTLQRGGLSAKKSWFYFDDRIVCLGAGITSEGDLAITTSINQCLASGDITIDDGKGASVAAKEIKEYPQLKWALQDHVGYVFPANQAVTLGAKDQTGDVKDVMGSSKSEKMTKPVFSIYLNHGIKPKDASYSYILVPGATAATLQTLSEKPDVTIISNTPELQAVRDDKQQLLQAIFHVPGTVTFPGGKTLAVDKPCVLQWDETKNQLSLADPTQKLTELTVTLNGQATLCTLPTGALAGSTLQQNLGQK